jgi:hypothetical protein
MSSEYKVRSAMGKLFPRPKQFSLTAISLPKSRTCTASAFAFLISAAVVLRRWLFFMPLVVLAYNECRNPYNKF